MRFQDLRLGTKQRIAFGVVLVMMAAATIFAISRLRVVKDELDRISDVWLPRTLALYDFKSDFVSLRNVQLQLALLDEPVRRSALLDSMLALQEDLDVGTAQLEESFLQDPVLQEAFSEEERELFEELERQWDAYLGLTFTMLELAEQNRQDEALALLNSEALQVYTAFSANLDRLVARIRQAADQAALEAEYTFRITRILTIGLLVATIVLSIFIAGALVQHITRPVKQLVYAARQVSEGNLDVHLEASTAVGRDELGTLTRAFDHMAKSLRTERARAEQQADTLFRQQDELQIAHAALQKSERHYRELVNYANSIILRWDTQGTILFVNPYGLRFFGYKPEELIGHSVIGTIVPETDSSGRDLVRMIRDITASPDRFLYNENEMRDKDGRRFWVVWTNRPLKTATGQCSEILSIGTDITELKKAREMLEHQQAEIEAKNRDLEAALDRLRATQQQLVIHEKLASLGQLTAGIAHEIKNPLNFVNNFASLAAELADELVTTLEANPSQPVGDVLKDIEEVLADLRFSTQKVTEHGRRADNIVHNMLQHSRGTPGERQQVPLNALLEEHLNLAYHGMRATEPSFNVTLERDYDDRVGALDVVPQELGRVFINLFNNAFQAVYQQAQTDGTAYSPTVTVRTKRLNGTVEVRVEDNGPGIPAGVQSRIFEPFFTTKPSGQGTGLGLSLSYDIVTQGHGGALRFESTEGNGAIFIVTLPG